MKPPDEAAIQFLVDAVLKMDDHPREARVQFLSGIIVGAYEAGYNVASRAGDHSGDDRDQLPGGVKGGG